MAAMTEIDRAIGAHGMWKLRLKAAIASGRMEAPIEAIRADEDCPFGKWLASPTIAPSTRGTTHYARVRELHAEFHQAAATVAELAVAGRAAEAEQMIAMSGDFSHAASRLTSAMQEWKRAMS